MITEEYSHCLLLSHNHFSALLLYTCINSTNVLLFQYLHVLYTLILEYLGLYVLALFCVLDFKKYLYTGVSIREWSIWEATW